MKPRTVLVRIIDKLYSDFNLNPTEKTKLDKLEVWHEALEGISDEAIMMGYKKIISDELKYIPASGAFKALCIKRQQSNTDHDPDNYPKVIPGLKQKNIRLILNNLKNGN